MIRSRGIFSMFLTLIIFACFILIFHRFSANHQSDGGPLDLVIDKIKEVIETLNLIADPSQLAIKDIDLNVDQIG